MIPKVIHYCWFGNGKYPKIFNKCLDSWKKYCPDYEIKLWTEDNYDVSKNKYLREAYASKKWAFVSDFARLDIIFNEGGIYLDTDTELIKPLDGLLMNECFFAREDENINTGLGFGSERHNLVVKELLNEYKDRSFIVGDRMEMTPCPILNTKPLLRRGYNPSIQVVQKISGVSIYPPKYFNPINGKTSELKIDSQTYGIHWYSGTWTVGREGIKSKIRMAIGLKNTYRIKQIIGLLTGK